MFPAVSPSCLKLLNSRKTPVPYSYLANAYSIIADACYVSWKKRKGKRERG